MLLPKQVREDALYVCTYKPGLNEYRWGTHWVDGVARNVPGAIVLTNLVGTVSPLGIFETGAQLRWDRGRPVEVKPVPPPPAVPAPIAKPKPKPKRKVTRKQADGDST